MYRSKQFCTTGITDAIIFQDVLNYVSETFLSLLDCEKLVNICYKADYIFKIGFKTTRSKVNFAFLFHLMHAVAKVIHSKGNA